MIEKKKKIEPIIFYIQFYFVLIFKFEISRINFYQFYEWWIWYKISKERKKNYVYNVFFNRSYLIYKYV